MRKKINGFVHIFILLTVLFTLIIGIGYLAYRNRLDFNTPIKRTYTYTSQTECEEKTGYKCIDQSCDLVPKGKTFDEVCGKNFKKGWVATKQELTSNLSVGWQKYSDRFNRFTFEYPNSARVIDNNDQIILSFPEQYQNISIRYHQSTGNSLREYLIKTYLPNSDGNYTQLDPMEIQVSTYKGYRAIAMIVDYGSPEYIVFESEDSKSVIDIEHFAFDDEPSIYIEGYEPSPSNSSEKLTFNQILSTFKFVD